MEGFLTKFACLAPVVKRTPGYPASTHQPGGFHFVFKSWMRSLASRTFSDFFKQLILELDFQCHFGNDAFKVCILSFQLSEGRINGSIAEL